METNLRRRLEHNVVRKVTSRLGVRKAPHAPGHESQPLPRLVRTVSERHAEQEPEEIQTELVETKQQGGVKLVRFPPIYIFVTERIRDILRGV